MKKISDTFVSAILVVDKNAINVAKKVKTTAAILHKKYANYEIIVIQNGLPESETASIRRLLPKIACIRLIQLSKTYDTDTAIFAGIEASIGDVACVLYNSDPEVHIPDFVALLEEYDIVFGVAKNIQRGSQTEKWGAKLFYWYSRNYLHINIPKGSTYYMGISRTAINALTRSGRFTRHVRYMSKQVGFRTTNYEYALPEGKKYSSLKLSEQLAKAIDLVTGYSSHPMRMLTYFGVFAGFLNILYAIYVVVVNVSKDHVAEGWTSLSLQSSLMFFILFMILAVLAEYLGKILNEVQQESPYHIMQELSSVVSIADETRRNVTKRSK